MADVIVLVDHHKGRVLRTTAELLTLADRLGDAVAVLAGGLAQDVDDAVTELGRWGARTVHVASDPAYLTHGAAPTAALLAEVVRGSDVAGVLLAATPEGTETAALLGLAIGSGVITDAIDVGPGLVATKAAFSGSFRTTSVVTHGVPVVTVRPDSVAPVQRPRTPRLVVVSSPRAVPPGAARVAAREPRTDSSRLGLAEASIVVAGGRGLDGDPAPVEDLADALGAAVGASRAAVDEGWLPHSAQVGQTGRTIAPEVYIAAGISGALPHVAGVRKAGTIVAVNTDPHAAIFEIADLGIVGDLFTVLPQAARAARTRPAGRSDRPEETTGDG